MPTYDYHCDACNHEFEKFQPITENPIRKCPKCGSLKARRLIGNGAGIIFKGSGFYQTDYKSKSSSFRKSEGGSDNAPCSSASSSCGCCPKAKK